MVKTPSGNQFLNPQEILGRIGVKEGMIVGDLGSGSGYFTFQAAKMVGNNGIVYALDIQKNALSALKSKAEFLGIKNIKLVWSNLEVVGAARRIANESLDLALLVNVLHQSKAHNNMFAEAHRMVKKGGMVLVVDWKESKLAFAPPTENLIRKDAAVRAAESQGLVKTDDFEASEQHYGLLFQK
ncbi:MAG: class I SAM-dependent methyltransferase [Patescibacteria group bacterium]|jgi:ubiquinone/menaquinone biosynthesis C-methylase UbiE